MSISILHLFFFAFFFKIKNALFGPGATEWQEGVSGSSMASQKAPR